MDTTPHTPTPSQAQQPIVYLVDDDPAVLDSLSMLLRSNGLEVIAYDSPEVFLSTYNQHHDHQIACVILDLRMPLFSGLDVQKILQLDNADLPIIFITGHGDVEQCAVAFKNGAVDFLTKPIDERALLKAIDTALQRSIEKHRQEAAHQEVETKLSRLSPREREVFKQVMQGASSKQIASVLQVSSRTIESHRASLFDKLECHSLAQLIRTYGHALDLA